MSTVAESSPHFLGLEGAKAIPTPGFQMAQVIVDVIVDRRSIGALYGDAGYGKTFAMRHAIANVDAGCEVLVTEFPYGATEKQVAGSSLKDLTGIDERGEKRVVIDGAARALRERPRLVVVDEAQRLDRRIIELLRFFHDDPSSTFALLFVGGNECWRVLSKHPMLSSRVQMAREFTRMDPDEVPGLIRSFHPAWAKADDALITDLDETVCHGVWRRWASLTVTLLEIAARMKKKPLDREVISFARSLAP